MVLWFVLLGITVGLRSMTAMAVLCWFAWLKLLPQSGWASWTGYLVTAIVFTVCALGEYVADTLPNTPSRKAPVGFIARLISGAVCGAALGATIQPGSAGASPASSLIGGLLAGVVGAVLGTLGGYQFRARLVRASGGKDLPIALPEDAIAIGGAILIVSRFA